VPLTKQSFTPREKPLNARFENHVLVLGAGGHAKVVSEILVDSGLHLAGFVTLAGSDEFFCGQRVFSEDQLTNLYTDGMQNIFPAIGDNRLRNNLAVKVKEMGFNIVNAIDPKSKVSRTARLGIGIAIMPGASVNADTTISDFGIINTNASVDHDCSIGIATHVAPGAALSGNVKVGSFSIIGTGASVRDNTTIGSNTTIGVGSAVVCDIPDDVIAVGTPARFSKK
jgi:UDP-perosamine 4-acetyltransferase